MEILPLKGPRSLIFAMKAKYNSTALWPPTTESLEWAVNPWAICVDKSDSTYYWSKFLIFEHENEIVHQLIALNKNLAIFKFRLLEGKIWVPTDIIIRAEEIYPVLKKRMDQFNEAHCWNTFGPALRPKGVAEIGRLDAAASVHYY